MEHTVAEWIGLTKRYLSLNQLRVDYPHVTSTEDCAEWAAFQKAFNEVSGSLEVPYGTYIIHQPVRRSTGNLHIHGIGRPTLQAKFDPLLANGIFDFWNDPTSFSADTSATSELLINSDYVVVTDPTNFKIGDNLRITSNEYSNGFAGVSGYAPTTRGEWNTVKKIDGNNIYLLDRSKDDYHLGIGWTVSGSTVSQGTLSIRVTALGSMESDISVTGITFLGEGVTPEGLEVNGRGAKGIQCTYWRNIHITDCVFSNQQRSAIGCYSCRDVIVTGCMFDGYDITKPNNQPDGSPWFTASQYIRCENVVFSSNIVRNARRPTDFEGSTGQALSRMAVMNGNISVNCQSMHGSHLCDRVYFTNNIGIGCENGIILRGQNCIIANNDIGHVKGYIIQLGSGSNSQDFDQPATIGEVIVSNNRGSTETTSSAVTIRQAADSLIINGNIFKTYGTAIASYGRYIKRLKIDGNVFTYYRSDGVLANENTHGILLLNVADYPNGVIEFNDVRIMNNTFENYYDGIRVNGDTNPMSPADSLDVYNNTFVNSRFLDFRQVRNSANLSHPFYNRVSFRNNNLSKELVNAVGLGQHGYGSLVEGNRTPYGFDSGELLPNTTGTIAGGRARLGQIVRNSNPTPGSYEKWICTKPGRTGAVVNTTVQCTIDSNLIVANTVPNNIWIGDIISVSAVGGTGTLFTGTVTSIDGANITLDVNSTVTGSAQTCYWQAPEFKGVGLIAT